LISTRPLVGKIAKVLGFPPLDLESEAKDQWTVSSASQRTVQPAVFLDGQLQKIQGTEFAPLETVVRDFQGGHQSMDAETIGFRIRDVDLVDGVLYGPKSIRHLRPRRHRWPVYQVPSTVPSGSLYETWIGNQWFGSWLMEDCITFELAQTHGHPVTSRPLVSDNHHAADYKSLLGMNPARVQHVHFEELIFFRDGPNNEGKRQRANRMRERLISKFPGESHPGVFVLRGDSGARRILLNEREIAEGLATRRGFRIIDPMKASVGEIIDACAGARVVAGVEGSQLVHGLVLMPPEAALFVIQPPHRVVSTLKMATDRQGQTYSFLVASGGKDEFSVAMDEVERTLDLVAAC
jgi:hypothetical protein